jgi:DNA-binding transcriptional regulator YiaG
MELQSENPSSNKISRIVTDKRYYLDPAIRRKLDILCERVSKYNHQNVIITDGKEGYGKSTLTATQAYYMAYTLKRKLRLFFDVEPLSQDAKVNHDMIYIWDDAAISGLTLESYNKEILKFIKILLLARKRRNTYFINIQEIFRLKEPIVARASGLNRVYSTNKVTLGKFVHIFEEPLQKLYSDWTHRKRKNYNLYYSLRGTFPDVLYDIFDDKEYESLKDEAILQIGESTKKGKTSFYEKLYFRLLGRLVEAWKESGLSQQQFSRNLKIPYSTFKDYVQNRKLPTGIDLEGETETIISKKCYIEPKPLNGLNPTKIDAIPIQWSQGSDPYRFKKTNQEQIV